MTPEEFAQAQERQAADTEAFAARRAASQSETQRLLEARKNGTPFDRKTQPTFTSLGIERMAQEALAREEAKAAKLAAATPRSVWFTTLPFQEQRRVTQWEAANPGLHFPMPAGFAVELKGV